MKYLLYTILIFIILALIGGVFHLFSLFRSVPELMLLVVIISAAERHDLDFIFICLVGGVMMDFISSVAFGSFTLSFLLVGFAVRYVFQDMLIARNPWKHLPWITVLAIVFEYLWLWLYNGLLFPFRLSLTSFTLHDIAIIIFGSILYTLVLFFPTYWFVEKLHGFLDSLEQRKKY